MVVAGLLRATDSPVELLTSCQAVRNLPPAQAARSLPAHIRGVVTLVGMGPDLANGSLAVDDGTGIWIGPASPAVTASLPADLQAGDLVEVWGRSREGHYVPTIGAEKIRRIGRAALPSPLAMTPLGLKSGVFDTQRVRIEGVVQAAHGELAGRRELRLVVSTALGPFNFVLTGQNTHSAAHLVDAEVSITGVFLSYFNSRRQFLGGRIYTNDPVDLVVMQPAQADAFAVPEVALGEVMAFSPQSTNLHRRRVRGTVTLCKPGHYFYLQERDRAIRIATRQTDPLQPGDFVEATGFFHLKQNKAEMQEAVFRRLSRRQPLEPVEITRERALVRQPRAINAPSEDYDDYLVALRGRLISMDQKQGEPLRLNLECEGVLVPAEFSGDDDATTIAAFRPGSELRLVGICNVKFSESYPVLDWPTPVGLSLLLRNAQDVQLLRAASWWTPERLWATLGLTAFVLSLALAWVGLLRRTVALRGAQLAEEMRARRDAAVEFESTLRERNRLAADLHDTTEQALTGLALQLEASEGLQTKAPDRGRHHLMLARQLLDRSREDLRRSIWNLRANALEKHTLAEALREVARDRSAGLNVHIAVACEGQERRLPDFVAANLLMLVHEGITNALKHAKPTKIVLHLAFSARELVLAIQDDGSGFDPAAAAGLEDGHFGLQGMRERVKRLGGRLKISSKPGHGTTVTATVPE